jgi:hypothetical protein
LNCIIKTRSHLSSTTLYKINKFSSIAYMIDIRRFHCDQMVRPKRYKPWKWPWLDNNNNTETKCQDGRHYTDK